SIVSGPLGTGPVNLTGGVLQNANSSIPEYVANSVTLHNAVTLINANTTIGGPAAPAAGAGGDINLAGPVTLRGASDTVNVVAGITSTISGNISGTGARTKAGAGPLLLSGNNTFGGGVTVNPTTGVLGNVGNLIVGSATALGTGLLTLAGGTLQDD